VLGVSTDALLLDQPTTASREHQLATKRSRRRTAASVG
jgi:hypothetical protein